MLGIVYGINQKMIPKLVFFHYSSEKINNEFEAQINKFMKQLGYSLDAVDHNSMKDARYMFFKRNKSLK